MKGSSIILATDLSKNAGFAAKWAHTFAEEHGLSVVVAHVVSISVSNWAEGAYDVLDDTAMMAKAEKKVVDWYAEETGDQPDDVCVLVGHTPVQLSEIAEEKDAAMLALSVSGKGAVKKFFLGSTAQSLANDPPCPVVVVTPEHAEMHKPPRFVVGIDFSKNASRALDFAADLARTAGAKLSIVHADTAPAIDVVDADDLPEKYVSNGHYEWAKEEMEKLLEAHADNLEGVDYEVQVIEDYPARGLLEYTDEVDADVLVVGRSGHSRFVSSVMGSVVLKALQAVEATTIIVPAQQPAQAE